MIWSALPWINTHISRTRVTSAGGGCLAKLYTNRVHGEYNLILRTGRSVVVLCGRRERVVRSRICIRLAHGMAELFHTAQVKG